MQRIFDASKHKKGIDDIHKAVIDTHISIVGMIIGFVLLAGRDCSA